MPRSSLSLYGIPRAARHAGDEPAGAFQDAVQHALRPAHFPQHVDVDRALATGDVERALHLLDRALDRIFDQFLMAFAPGQRAVDLRNDLAVGIVAVGVHRGHRADAARGGPGTG